MSDSAQYIEDQHLDLAVEIIAAYVANNSVPMSELPALIGNTYRALRGLSDPAVPVPATADDIEKPSPAQIRKSVTPDAIISFLDGKSYKTLKRHLGIHGFEPHSYRQRYGLPNDYPMVAPSYAAQRSELAKSIGLGRPGGRADAATAAEEPKKPRGRSKTA